MQGAPARRELAPDFDQASAALGLAPQAVAQLQAEIRDYSPQDPQDQQDQQDPQDQGQIELWPEHATPVAIFIRMRGQWRLGPGGPIALDYAALDTVGRLMRIGPRQQRAAFEPLRALEAHALAWFAEQQQA